MRNISYYFSLFIIFLLIFVFSCVRKKHSHSFQSKENVPVLVKDTTQLIQRLAESKPELAKVLANAEKYEIQIIYTQIDRDKTNSPHFRQYSFRVNENAYFNPASFVKLPTLMLALEKLKSISNLRIGPETRIRYGAEHECQTPLERDTMSENGFPSLGLFMRKALLTSDNDAYNRLYEFVGQQYLHKRLNELGFPKVRIVNRFAPCCYDCNRYTNPIDFLDEKGKLLYHQPMLINPVIPDNPQGKVSKGTEYMQYDGTLVQKPRDYSQANFLSLQDMHNLLLISLFPSAFDSCKTFLLSESEYHFVWKYMGLFPEESEINAYRNTEAYTYDFKKYFLWKKTSNIRCFNINMFTYGYIGDAAYVVDFENKVEYILLAVIYTNETQSIQPKNYQYNTLGIPFLKNLSQAIWEYEKSRKKPVSPDLTVWKKLFE